jgi:hypothetical protein
MRGANGSYFVPILQLLKTVNQLLANKVVQWALLISFCISLLCLLWVDILNQKCKVEAALLLSQKATLEAQVDVQNQAIQKAGQDYADNKKRLDVALLRANELEKQRQELPRLSGTCEQMVRQLTDTIVSIKGN